MKPLRQCQDDADVETAFAARLVATTAPRPPAPEARARVRAALRRRRQRPRLVLRPLAVALVVLLGMTAAASARYGREATARVAALVRALVVERRWPRHAGPSEAPTTAPAPTAAPAPIARAALAPPAPSPPSVQPEPPPRVGPRARVLPTVAPPPQDDEATARATLTRPAPTPAASAARASEPGDAALVVDAYRLLRVEREYAAAAARLDAYLQRHPDAPLVEEALALRIEAAARSGDAAAAGLAAQYLARFPAGRFAAMARKIVARSFPPGERIP